MSDFQAISQKAYVAASNIEKATLMNHLQILHIMQCAELGGMQRSAIEMMSALQMLNASNRLVSLHPIGRLGPLLEQRGIPARGLQYRGPWGIFSIPEMARNAPAASSLSLPCESAAFKTESARRSGLISRASPTRGSPMRQPTGKPPMLGYRSTSISAVSSTRSCICFIRAFLPAP